MMSEYERAGPKPERRIELRDECVYMCVGACHIHFRIIHKYTLTIYTKAFLGPFSLLSHPQSILSILPIRLLLFLPSCPLSLSPSLFHININIRSRGLPLRNSFGEFGGVYKTGTTTKKSCVSFKEGRAKLTSPDEFDDDAIICRTPLSPSTSKENNPVLFVLNGGGGDEGGGGRGGGEGEPEGYKQSKVLTSFT